MLFAAQSAAPLASPQGIWQPILAQSDAHPLTLFSAPAGFLITDHLATLLAERQRPMMWLRLEAGDQDPAHLLCALIAAARRLAPDCGAHTLAQMRQRPGPIFGWPPLFEQLQHELGTGLPPTTVLVIERLHCLDGPTPALGLLLRYILSALPPEMLCLLTAQHKLPHLALPAQAGYFGVDTLRLNEQQALVLRETVGSPLSEASTRRVVRLTNGCPTSLRAAFAAYSELGPATVKRAIEHATNADDLLLRLAKAWLLLIEPESLPPLALALRLEYSHPDLVRGAFSDCPNPTGIWWQPLTGGWSRLRERWRGPFRLALRQAIRLPPAALYRAAEYLNDHEAIEPAVRLYLETGDDLLAARVIAAHTSQLLDDGEWLTLENTFRLLPEAARQSQPQLLFTLGELAAARGELAPARRTFSNASRLFARSQHSQGMCLSLLAESTVAAWLGDHTNAYLCAQRAVTTARQAALTDLECWADWQLGCLAVTAGEPQLAVDYFTQAIALADASTVEALRPVEALARYWREVQQQRDFHRNACEAAERAEHRLVERVRDSVTTPAAPLEGLLRTHGWSGVPLVAKLPAPIQERQAPPWEVVNFAGVWSTLRNWFSRTPFTSTDEPPAFPWLTVELPLLDNPTADTATSESGPDVIEVPKWTPVVTASDQPPDAQHQRPPTLTVNLLGTFHIAVNGRLIEHWPKEKGLAIFKYLLLQRDRAALRDVLMDVFWPEVEPESARNRLNVALHHLRQTLRTLTDVPLVIFDSGVYQFNPEVRLQLDTDEFERYVEAGRRAEAEGNITKAMRSYQQAIKLYQGDLLADDPYESWPVLARERLRIAFLDTLDRLSQLCFDCERYNECVSVCQRLLQYDNCREDAHARLMRTYCQMGKPLLALRQYQTASEALRAELGVQPSTELQILSDRVRRQQAV